MEPSLKKEMIKAEAEKLGFCFSGFTGMAEPRDFPRYAEWIAKESYGQMAFLARADHVEKRQNPSLIFPQAKTIAVLGVSLDPAPPAPIQIAHFAQYRDYHDTLRAACEQLLHTVARMADEPLASFVCVDSSPVLERSLAVQAGLGWIGKNSQLIHPKFGSRTLLCECFLSWELPPDAPLEIDRCGSCTRCVVHCPTGCIDADSRTIHADRCVSYLTIEHRGAFPAELQPLIGNRLFGCDACVDVCPWNRKAAPRPTPLVKADYPAWNEGLLCISEEVYRRIFKGTPFERLKRERFLRNFENALQGRNQ